MASRCSFVNPTESSLSKDERTAKVSMTEWKLCAICQQDTCEKLLDPSNVLGKRQCGYKLLAETLSDFSDLECLPEDLQLGRLDNGNGIEDTLKQNHAVWHKSCRNRFDKQKLQRAQKRKANKLREPDTSPMKTRHSGTVSMARSANCFFCYGNDKNEKLHQAQTHQLDQRVREYANILQDRQLLGKLSEGDMHALDAFYHSSCMTALHNRVRKHENLQKPGDVPSLSGSLILSELVSYMEDCRQDETMPVFKLSDLAKLYESRLSEQCPDAAGKIHTTRLKERLMNAIPDLRAQQQGREVLLMFDSDIGQAIKIACSQNDNDAMHLARAAQILRKDIFSKEYSFDGSFKPGCENDAVPQSLLALVSMILWGPSIQQQKDHGASGDAAISLSQLLVFNAKKTEKSNREPGSRSRHNKSRETPLAIYTGLMLHAKTRQRGVIEKLSSRGLCISYDRVQEIGKQLASEVCTQFERDGCVCPALMKGDLFTVGAVDNIDHNPSARNAMDSFHGTAISLMQFPTQDNPGTDREPITISPATERTMILPAEYTGVAPATLPQADLIAPASTAECKAETTLLAASNQIEFGWLDTMANLVQTKDAIGADEYVSWAAYHADRELVEDSRPLTKISLLPLLTEPAHCVATILHAINHVRNAVNFLNHGQTPVITMDQPLFCIAKQIQWAWPEVHGESMLVVVMGGLHIEMNLLKLIGDFLSGSGWTTLLVQSEVTTAGRADAILKGLHVTRSRYVHQVTAASLYILKTLAYKSYVESLPDQDETLDFNAWCTTKIEQSPQFQYWDLVLKLELLGMQFVRSQRQANFQLYVECLGQIVPWMFALDHTNYARWLPVHIKDMVQLGTQAPLVHDEFNKGHFVVKKSPKVFSQMAMDQAHEQMNDQLKGEGGIIGITDSPSALIQWTTAGPEIARINDQFEKSKETTRTSSTKHHDQTHTVQKQFASHVNSMVSTFQDLGNPFMEDSNDLIQIDTKEVMNEKAVRSVRTIESVGKAQYDTYVRDRLEQRTVPVSDIISKNNMTLFHKTVPRKQTKASLQISSLKSNCEMFSRMYISCQSRDGDMDEFFRHENQGAPPSLSDMGQLRQGNKSDLIKCSDRLVQPSNNNLPAVDAKLLDGGVLVNMLIPKTCATFGDYAEQVFLPYIQRNLLTTQRLDVVWDRYFPGSLKSSTRQKRGSGVRVKVTRTTPIPKNWQSFLRVDENKRDLFQFLSTCISQIAPEGKQVFCTEGPTVLTAHESNIDEDLSPCDHEEADTRLILHALHCSQKGHRRVFIRSVDTDVVVLAVASFHRLSLDELWVAFGVKKNYRLIPAHELATALGEKANALLFFHAFTGSDTTSSFNGIGKVTAWDTWMAFPEISTTFARLSGRPDAITDHDLSRLERYVILLYDRTSDMTDVNRARKHLFAKGRQLDRIPPTKAALLEHAKRSAYQAGHVWAQSLVANQQLPQPSAWGWTEITENRWIPFWTALPEASKSCKELIKCNCKKSCRPPCKCSSASLPCTELCNCSGTCFQTESAHP